MVVHAGGVARPRFTLGGRNDTMIEALRDACIRAGGIDLQTVENIDQVLWIKFVTVCATASASLRLFPDFQN